MNSARVSHLRASVVFCLAGAVCLGAGCSPTNVDVDDPGAVDGGSDGALRPIDAITGATTADDILNRIFSTFCIGK